MQGLSLPLLIRWLKIKPQDNTDEEEKELQLFLATNTLHYIEKELSVQLDVKSEAQLKKKYEQMIKDVTSELRLYKKGKRTDKKTEVIVPDFMLNAKLEIRKFQRTLLLRLHKKGEFSDTVIKKVEREMDIDELQLNSQVPKKE